MTASSSCARPTNCTETGALTYVEGSSGDNIGCKHQNTVQWWIGATDRTHSFVDPHYRGICGPVFWRPVTDQPWSQEYTARYNQERSRSLYNSRLCSKSVNFRVIDEDAVLPILPMWGCCVGRDRRNDCVHRPTRASFRSCLFPIAKIVLSQGPTPILQLPRLVGRCIWLAQVEPDRYDIACHDRAHGGNDRLASSRSHCSVVLRSASTPYS